MLKWIGFCMFKLAERAKENLPGGSLKYLFVYLKIRIFKCSYCTIYIYLLWNHKAACCQSVAAVAVRAFCLLAYNRLKALLNRDVAHMYIGTTDVVRGCWFLTPPLRLMLFQTSLCWNLTTNMLNRNDIMLFLCWVSQPVHFTKLRYWQKTVV